MLYFYLLQNLLLILYGCIISVKLFINGALAGETPVSGSLVHPTDNGAKYLCIGADSDATGAGEYPCKGLVYLVRMYTAAATDGQALYLYEQSAK